MPSARLPFVRTMDRCHFQHVWHRSPIPDRGHRFAAVDNRPGPGLWQRLSTTEMTVMMIVITANCRPLPTGISEDKTSYTTRYLHPTVISPSRHQMALLQQSGTFHELLFAVIILQVRFFSDCCWLLRALEPHTSVSASSKRRRCRQLLCSTNVC